MYDKVVPPVRQFSECHSAILRDRSSFAASFSDIPQKGIYERPLQSLHVVG